VEEVRMTDARRHEGRAAALRRARVRSLLLDGSAARTPRAVVEWFGAMQGQDGPGVEWSVGLRAGGDAGAVAAALASGEILRTWPMRGTLHLVPGRDARWMVRHLSARSAAQAARRRAALGIDEPTAERAVEVLAAAIDGSPTGLLTRRDCVRALAEAGIDTGGQRAYHLLVHASMRGITCVGPTRDGEQTFALLDRWAPAGDALDRPAALATIATSFVRSHGPVTVADLARWADLTLTDARAGVAAATGIVTRDVEGLPMLAFEEALDEGPGLGRGADPPPTAHALPGYDELVLGYRDRSAQLDPADEPRIVPGGNGVFARTLVVDGRVVGTWRRTPRAGRVLLEACPFAPLPARTRAGLAAALASYAAFVAQPAEVRWVG
jgi:hypothetical protein